MYFCLKIQFDDAISKLPDVCFLFISFLSHLLFSSSVRKIWLCLSKSQWTTKRIHSKYLISISDRHRSKHYFKYDRILCNQIDYFFPFLFPVNRTIIINFECWKYFGWFFSMTIADQTTKYLVTLTKPTTFHLLELKKESKRIEEIEIYWLN